MQKKYNVLFICFISVILMCTACIKPISSNAVNKPATERETNTTVNNEKITESTKENATEVEDVYTDIDIINETVPIVSGKNMTLDEVRATLYVLGFENVTFKYEFSEKIEKGNVISISGATEGEKAPITTSITVIVSMGQNYVEEKGSVYYLNFRPAQEKAWQTLADKYEEETGVEVTVVTAESGTYEKTLQKEIESANAPTMFQVNGYVGLETWKDYCYDLSKAKITKELTTSEYSLMEGKSVYGIGYVIESYGIIVNKTLLSKAGYDISDINSFEDLKMVAEDITDRSDKLGFAAFTSAGMELNSDWRFKTHLANLPIYYEYEKDGIKNTQAIKGTYLDNYRDIFDLYINNSTCDGADLSDMSVEDARNEFLEGKAVFYQNGTWEYDALSEVYSDNELAIIPIYFGVGDEANQGLCTGTESYWCVNKNATKEDIQATLDFMYWCVTSQTGTEIMAYDMGFNIPFKKAVEPENILDKQDAMYTAQGKVPVTWTFITMPSERWKNNVGIALTEYAKNPTDMKWRAVEDAFVDGWSSEY